MPLRQDYEVRFKDRRGMLRMVDLGLGMYALEANNKETHVETIEKSGISQKHVLNFLLDHFVM